MKKTSIEWTSIKVKIKLIDPTPDNYKIRNALGYERFLELLKKFGLAGNVILNFSSKFKSIATYKGRFVLIDGNSRIAEAKKKGRDWVWASVPDRQLNPEEFKEFSAMFDYGKAGDVDIERITREYEKSSKFFERYGLQVPQGLLDKMGAKGKVVKFPGGGKGGKAPEEVDVKMVSLFFDTKQESDFRKWEESLMKRFRTTNTTETVLAVFKATAKK